MVHLEWEIDRRDDVTFVAAAVHNAQTTPQTVRLESRLDGPTWLPRDDGFPTPPRSADLTITVEPNRRRGVGFASPAPPTEPPVEIVDANRATAVERSNPETVLASLEAWAPTTDVLTRGP